MVTASRWAGSRSARSASASKVGIASIVAPPTALGRCEAFTRASRHVGVTLRDVPSDRPNVTLRAIRPYDIPALAAMLARPEVARWWPGYTLERVEKEFLDEELDLTLYAIEADGGLAGSIQSYEESEADFRHANIDLFVDPDLHGRGIGTTAIRQLAAQLIDEKGHHRLTIDPAADNTVAVRVYEKVGFHAVGRMRQYQRMADGSWADGLMMEMLANELVR